MKTTDQLRCWLAAPLPGSWRTVRVRVARDRSGASVWTQRPGEPWEALCSGRTRGLALARALQMVAFC